MENLGLHSPLEAVFARTAHHRGLSVSEMCENVSCAPYQMCVTCLLPQDVLTDYRSNCMQLMDQCIDTNRARGQLDSAILCGIITHRLGDLSLNAITSALFTSVSPDHIVDVGFSESSCIDINQFVPQAKEPPLAGFQAEERALSPSAG